MYDDDGNVRHTPQWMNARNYSALILPPDCPTPDYIAILFDAPHDGSHAHAPPSPGFFPHQPQHNLARLGARAQRRYRISSEEWQRRRGP